MRRIKIAGLVIAFICTLFMPVSAKSTFEDVDDSYWYAPYVIQANNEGIMTGTSEGVFSPYGQMNRAMAAVVFYRLAGSPATSYQPIFPDVPDGQYYSKAVTWAYQNKVISGYDSGIFAPLDSLTREQMILMAFRYKKANDGVSWGDVSLASYNDASRISAYAYEAVLWGLYYNIMGSVQNNLHPEQPITRAESCRILMLAEHIKNGQDPATIEEIPTDEYCPHINTQVLTLSTADCQHDGVTEVQCIDCKSELEKEVVQSSHEFDWITIQYAYYGHYGIRQYQCRYCGYIKQQDIFNEAGQIISSEFYDGSVTPPSSGIQTPGNGGQTSGGQNVDIGADSIYVEGEFSDSLAQEVFNLCNSLRAQSGLNAFQWGSLCENEVKIRAAELALEPSHMRPNGQHALEYYQLHPQVARASENIAYFYSEASAQDAVQMWLNSPTHAKYIYSTDLPYLAVGVFREKSGTGYNYYFVQCFYSK